MGLNNVISLKGAREGHRLYPVVAIWSCTVVYDTLRPLEWVDKVQGVLYCSILISGNGVCKSWSCWWCLSVGPFLCILGSLVSSIMGMLPEDSCHWHPSIYFLHCVAGSCGTEAVSKHIGWKVCPGQVVSIVWILHIQKAIHFYIHTQVQLNIFHS